MSIKHSRILISIFIFLFLAAGTTVAIYFAKGYRPNLQGGKIQGTGLLSATSYPESAQVYINGKLTTATDDTINLLPGQYDVSISKEGFITWQKKLNVQSELVTATSARLFPSVPSLSASTFSGAKNPLLSVDGKRVAYLVTSAQIDSDNGLYIMDINSSPFAFGKNPIHLAVIPNTTNPDHILFSFSPDGKQILLAFTDNKGEAISSSYILDTDKLTNINTAPDASIRLPLIFSQWEETLTNFHQESLKLLPEFMVDVATASANVFFSPDGEKMLYTTTYDLNIPDNLKDPLDSINSTPQQRGLKANHTYVYDIKEDTNYLIYEIKDPKTLITTQLLSLPRVTPTSEVGTPAASGSKPLYNQLQQEQTTLTTLKLFRLYTYPVLTGNPLWYTTSRHLIDLKDGKITIFEYDNTNHATVYSGPFENSFIAPSLNGNRLLLLTNLNQVGSPANLYSLDLK